jgi:hypothetical protein
LYRYTFDEKRIGEGKMNEKIEKKTSGKRRILG